MRAPLLTGSGTLARSPRGARAYVRVMAVLMANSSTKTKRSAGSVACLAANSARATGSASLARRDFFSRQGQFRQPAPDGAEADADPFLFLDSLAEFVQGGLRLGRHQLGQHPPVLRRQLGARPTPVGQGSEIVLFTSLLEQFVNGRGMHLEDAGNLLNGTELLVHRLNDAVAEYKGIELQINTLPGLPIFTQTKTLVSLLGSLSDSQTRIKVRLLSVLSLYL